VFSPTGLVNCTFLVFFASFAPLRLCAQNNLAINGSRDAETAVPIAGILFLNLYHYPPARIGRMHFAIQPLQVGRGPQQKRYTRC
jgi:hypothetical protein